MAIQARITEARHTTQETDAYGETREIDRSLHGELVVIAEYADSDNPESVLHRERLIVSGVETEAQIVDRVLAHGTLIQAARDRTAELTARAGTWLTPEPEEGEDG